MIKLPPTKPLLWTEGFQQDALRVINVHFLATTLARALCPPAWSHFHTASFTSVCDSQDS